MGKVVCLAWREGDKGERRSRGARGPGNHLERNLLHPCWTREGRVWAQMTRNKSNAPRYTPPSLRQRSLPPALHSPLDPLRPPRKLEGFPVGSEQSISGIRNVCSAGPPFPSLSAIIPRYNAHCFATLTVSFCDCVRVVKRVVVEYTFSLFRWWNFRWKGGVVVVKRRVCNFRSSFLSWKRFEEEEDFVKGKFIAF